MASMPILIADAGLWTAHILLMLLVEIPGEYSIYLPRKVARYTGVAGQVTYETHISAIQGSSQHTQNRGKVLLIRKKNLWSSESLEPRFHRVMFQAP